VEAAVDESGRRTPRIWEVLSLDLGGAAVDEELDAVDET